jgi:hypothetical protein
VLRKLLPPRNRPPAGRAGEEGIGEATPHNRRRAARDQGGLLSDGAARHTRPLGKPATEEAISEAMP